MIEAKKLWKRKTIIALLAFSLLPQLLIPASQAWMGYKPSWEDFLGVSPSPLFAFTPYSWSWLVPILIGVEAIKADEGLVQFTIPPLGRKRYFALKVASNVIMLMVLYMPLAIVLSIIYLSFKPTLYASIYLLASLQLASLASTLALYSSSLTVVLFSFALALLFEVLRVPAFFYLGKIGYALLPLLSPFSVAKNFADKYYWPLAFAAVWDLAFTLLLFFAIMRKDF